MEIRVLPNRPDSVNVVNLTDDTKFVKDFLQYTLRGVFFNTFVADSEKVKVLTISKTIFIERCLINLKESYETFCKNNKYDVNVEECVLCSYMMEIIKYTASGDVIYLYVEE